MPIVVIAVVVGSAWYYWAHEKLKKQKTLAASLLVQYKPFKPAPVPPKVVPAPKVLTAQEQRIQTVTKTWNAIKNGHPAYNSAVWLQQFADQLPEPYLQSVKDEVLARLKMLVPGTTVYTPVTTTTTPSLTTQATDYAIGKGVKAVGDLSGSVDLSGGFKL